MKYLKTASRLREILDEKRMSQQDLADRSKLGKASISHYVNGSNEPSSKSAFQMAQVLGVTPAWLMGFDVPKYPDTFIDINKPTEAEELYKRYQEAIPEIRAAVDSLLRPKSDT